MALLLLFLLVISAASADEGEALNEPSVVHLELSWDFNLYLTTLKLFS